MIRKRFLLLVISLVYLSLFSCKPYPKDPNHSLQTIKHGGFIRVGLIYNPPWVSAVGKSPSGVEVKLVQAFANDIGVKIKWHAVSMQQGFSLLDKNKIDVLVGGLTKSIPYKKAAFTRAYCSKVDPISKEKSHHVFAIHAGENHFLMVLDQFLQQKGQCVISHREGR